MGGPYGHYKKIRPVGLLWRGRDRKDVTIGASGSNKGESATEKGKPKERWRFLLDTLCAKCSVILYKVASPSNCSKKDNKLFFQQLYTLNNLP